MNGQKIRGYQVDCHVGTGPIWAGTGLKELEDTLKNIVCIQDLLPGEAVKITVVEKTQEEIDKIPEL